MKRIIGAALLVGLAATATVTKAEAQQPTQASIEALLPDFEKQVAEGMKAFSVPGVAVGIVHDDKLIYTKGFGVRELGKPDEVTPETIFQVGSAYTDASNTYDPGGRLGQIMIRINW